MVPVFGAPIGAFLGSVVTDWIDKGWANIKWGKAGVSAALAFILDIPAIQITTNIDLTKVIQYALSYRGALLGSITGLIDLFWGKKKNAKS